MGAMLVWAGFLGAWIMFDIIWFLNLFHIITITLH